MNSCCSSSLHPPVVYNRFSHRLKLSSFGFRFFGDEKSFKWRSASQLRLHSQMNSCSREIRAVNPSSSPWDDKPTELLPSGKRVYLDEQDVVTLLDPPKQLIPLDPASYNPAAYLWKKIEDIPEERRYRLLVLLKPRLISRLWEIAGTRYDDSKMVKKSASKLLSIGNVSISPEYWNCRSSGGPVPMCWTNGFKKDATTRKQKLNVLGESPENCPYKQSQMTHTIPSERINGGSLLPGMLSFSSPLYFSVSQVKEVMPTEQPCDLAYEFGDGLLDLHDYPEGFPKPAKHPRPFDDHVVFYIRHAGPGVLVGQAWQEGKVLEQVPKKFCGEILMVQDFSACLPMGQEK